MRASARGGSIDFLEYLRTVGVPVVREIGKGEYGRVFLVDATRLGGLVSRLKGVVHDAPVPSAGTVAVKLAQPDPEVDDSWAAWVQANAHEADVHKHLANRCDVVAPSANGACVRFMLQLEFTLKPLKIVGG